MDDCFKYMDRKMKNKKLPPRTRFMLQDIIEFRQNKVLCSYCMIYNGTMIRSFKHSLIRLHLQWVPRRSMVENGPKSINEIRQEAGMRVRSIPQFI